MTAVEELTRQAAHRRDHVHPEGAVPCALVAEVICLGRGCFVVCHHCGMETGLLGPREAQAVADGHACP